MAEDGNVVMEVVPAATDQETLSLVEDQPVIDSHKLVETEVDLNDIRSTNPDGAQSPASSTYADCEETDLPNSPSADEITNKKVSVIEEDVITTILDNEYVDVNLSPVVSTKNNEEEEMNHIDKKAVVTNGVEGTDTVSKEESKVEVVDCEYVDSEEYEIEGISPDEGISADEYGSHDSQEEHDRENGDGEEVNQDDAAQKKLDDDEDRRNPQYIPKRGFFYEHDDRTADTELEGQTEGLVKEAPTTELESKRKGRRSVPDGRWKHDLYKEEEQQSKSTQELINVYGYDIRNEESAPKARRRRKYGRGPNRYTRKWDDEDAYGKQTGKAFRSTRRQKPLPVKREEYDAEFPELDRQPRPKAKSRERRKSPVPPKPNRNHDVTRNEGEMKYSEERRRTPPRKYNSDYVVERSSRSFTKRIPSAASSAPPKVHYNDALDAINDSLPAPMRTKMVVNNSFTNSSRGRGIAHGKMLPRHINNTNEYDEPTRAPTETRMQFLPANRGRAKRMDRPCPNQGFFVGKSSNDDELRELTEQMAAADLRASRNAANRSELERRAIPNELIHELSAPTNSTIRSKRYSYQRQRLLPDSNNDSKNIMDAGLHALSNIQSVSEHGGVTNVLQPADNNALHQVANVTVSRNSVPMIPENQLTTAPPSNTSSLSVNAASIQSNSLAVSAPLIPLSATPMTASGAALQAGAPPLPIMGFFQHPQGFTNQGTAAQMYTRDQNMLAAPSNQPVQLVAFLPASPMMSNTNHTPSASAAPPPPPPPPSYPTSVISYPQASPTQQTQQSFSSETYSMPPVTLAPIHQAEMYQSRGGVTYYNTRSQVKPRSPPPPRVKTAIPIVPPPNED